MAGYWLNGVKYSNVQLVAGENALSLDYWIGNANLTMMVVPESVTSIEGTFQQFPNLAEIVVANSVQVVANLDTAFANTEAVGNDGLFWVADNLLTAYQTAYPTLNFDKWTNYTQYTIPYIGNAELTASYVQQLAQANPAARSAATVIVPVEFTSYESGAITAIQTAFTNMGHLVTTYENGSIDLDMNGDIVAKIVEIGGTVDNALRESKAIEQEAMDGQITSSVSAPYIIPPLSVWDLPYSLSKNNTNLVLGYLCAKQHTAYSACYCFDGATNLIEGHIGKYSTSLSSIEITATFRGCSSLKRATIDFGGVAITGWGLFQSASNVEDLLLTDLISNFNVSFSTQFTRQSLVDLIDSLGTPATQQTLTIGATNLAKLSADDLAIATAKNWVVQ